MDTPWYILTEISRFVTEAAGNSFLDTKLYFHILKNCQQLVIGKNWNV